MPGLLNPRSSEYFSLVLLYVRGILEPWDCSSGNMFNFLQKDLLGKVWTSSSEERRKKKLMHPHTIKSMPRSRIGQFRLRRNTRADLTMGRRPVAIACFFSSRTAYSVPSLALRRAGFYLAARVDREMMVTNYSVVDPNFFRVQTKTQLRRFLFPKGRNPLFRVHAVYFSLCCIFFSHCC